MQLSNIRSEAGKMTHWKTTAHMFPCSPRTRLFIIKIYKHVDSNVGKRRANHESSLGRPRVSAVRSRAVSLIHPKRLSSVDCTTCVNSFTASSPRLLHYRLSPLCQTADLLSSAWAPIRPETASSQHAVFRACGQLEREHSTLHSPLVTFGARTSDAVIFCLNTMGLQVEVAWVDKVRASVKKKKNTTWSQGKRCNTI